MNSLLARCASALVLIAPVMSRAADAPALDPAKLVIEHTEAAVKIGPLSFVGRQTTMAEIETALGKPDRVVEEGRYIRYCYDRLGLRFEHPVKATTNGVEASIFFVGKLTPEEEAVMGAVPKQAFPGVLRIRGVEFKAPCKAKDVYTKLNPLFTREEASPGNDQFGNSIRRFGNCQTTFHFRQGTGDVFSVSLGGAIPK